MQPSSVWRTIRVAVIAYLFVGFLDLAHTRTYKGMMVFEASQDANTPTQLWIIARYLESLSVLIAPVFFKRRIQPFWVFSIFILITGFMLWTVSADLFPVCFVEGKGLTPFKKISEYIICVILLGAFSMLHANRARFSPAIFKLLAASIILTICSELAFTIYIGVYDFSNIIGHFFKFVAFYLIYKALVETGLKEPYEFLFRELKESEKKYLTLFANMLNGFAYHKVLLNDDNLPVDHLFLEVNEAFEKMIGLSRGQIIGKKVTEVWPSVPRRKFRRLKRSFSRNGNAIASWRGAYLKLRQASGLATKRFEEVAVKLGEIAGWASQLGSGKRQPLA